MNDPTGHSPSNDIAGISLNPGFDAVSRLEPLAVPLGRLTSILRRHLWVILVVFAVGVGGTVVVVKRMPKLYTADASILIEPQRTQVSDLQAISPDSQDVGGLVRTQIDILRSPALALGVVRALDLARNPEFAPRPGGLVSKLKTLLANIGREPGVAPSPPTEAEMAQTAAAILSGKLSFANETRSSVLTVAVTTQDPALSANIANEVVHQYLDFKRQEKFAAMQRAHDWFQEQMGKLADQSLAANRAVEQYRREHGLEEQPPDDGVTAPAETVTSNRRQLDAIGNQLTDVSRERALKEGQLAQAQAVLHGQTPVSTLPEVIASPAITALAGQISTAAGIEAQIASAKGAADPQLIAVRAQLAKLQAREKQEEANIVASLTAAMQASRTQERLLRQQMAQLRDAVTDENSAQVGLQALLTKARATRSIYESFLSRETQLANVAGIQEPDASLVSTATPPLGPSAPQTMRLAGVAALLSLVVGIALSCVIERLRGGFSLPEQLEATLGLRVIGMVPKVPNAVLRGRPIGRNGMLFRAAIDRIRAHFRTLGDDRPKIIMITSALPKEGKSVFASALARNVAAAGWRVMLIECDFGRPSLAARFGIPTGPGLCDILTGELLGATAAVLHEPAPRLHVITAGRVAGDGQELLASDRMTALLAASRRQYDLVLLDTPPVLPVADALVLARQADATLMVVRWEKTARSAAQDAMRLLRESRARIFGTVMTRVDAKIAARSGGRISYALTNYDGYHVAPIGRT
jgi:succinoglycan biosynthesis transport protein ExoP